MLTVLPVPRGFESPAGLVECRAGLRGASARGVEGFGEAGNLGRATFLEALVDCPGIATGFPNQRRDAYVVQLSAPDTTQ